LEIFCQETDSGTTTKTKTKETTKATTTKCGMNVKRKQDRTKVYKKMIPKLVSHPFHFQQMNAGSHHEIHTNGTKRSFHGYRCEGACRYCICGERGHV
jgi:hypothetical protein